MKKVIALLRRAWRWEIGMWRSLGRWVARRPHVPKGSTPFAYTGPVMVLLWVFIIVSAIEIPVVDLLLPWESARFVVFALGAYGLFWMIGLAASLRVHPHLVSAEGLRVRSGISFDLTVPWSSVERIERRYRSLPPGTKKVEGDVGYLNVGNQTSVDLVFREPVTVPLKGGSTVTELRFHADDADELVALARSYLASSPAAR